LIIDKTMVVKKDEIRRRIVTVAGKIFTRYGFRKTSMDQIANATKKGTSSIYYYFNSKEEIFRAVVEKEAAELTKDLHEAIDKVEDPIEKLRTYVLFRMKKLNTLTNFYSALKHEYLDHLDFIENIRKDYDKNEIMVLGSILQSGIDQGKFSVEDPELAAVAIATAMKGLELPLFINKEHGNIEDRLDNLINFLFYGLVKR
jgi:AcrR family transcriptional regulator